jgi:hypothetical protein
MPSELYVQVPIRYGDFAWPDPALDHLLRYGREANGLLHLHLRMVLWSREQRTDGFVPFGYLRRLSQPASVRIARRDAQRLVDAGLIEPREGGDYFVPAAVDWPIVRKGTRDYISDFIRQRVYERDGYLCVHCSSADNLTLDHIIPWSKGGEDKVSNLQTLCGSCNSKKKARA